MKIVTAAQMKEIELASLQHDLTFHRLMENAGSAAAAYIRRTIPVEGRNCIVFCSKGNNGGDGFVVARKLFENGANVIIVLTDGVPKGEEAFSMFNTVKLMAVPILEFDLDYADVRGYLEHADIIVDAMFGTGFKGELTEYHRQVTQAVNQAVAAVVSLDIPSGVETDTGMAAIDCIHADFTVVFDSLKPAHVIPSGAKYCGVIEVVDIGIPPQARENVQSRFTILDEAAVFTLLPKRDPNSHKGTFGRLLNISGCSRYTGAPVLSSLGALRSGVGYVILASTREVCFAAAARLTEAVMSPLPADESGGILYEAGENHPLMRQLDGANAVLIGCGLGDGSSVSLLMENVIRRAKCPVIIDADGINAVSRNIHVLKEASCPVILTPHLGEMARLTGISVDRLREDSFSIAVSFAAEHGVTLVLKGPKTLTVSPDGQIYVNTTGNPGLAKAGSGDVLAGMIGAFAAQGVPPLQAAACGVFLHGLAADRTAARLSQYAMLPSDLLLDLSKIFLQNDR